MLNHPFLSLGDSKKQFKKEKFFNKLRKELSYNYLYETAMYMEVDNSLTLEVITLAIIGTKLRKERRQKSIRKTTGTMMNWEGQISSSQKKDPLH